MGPKDDSDKASWQLAVQSIIRAITGHPILNTACHACRHQSRWMCIRGYSVYYLPDCHRLTRIISEPKCPPALPSNEPETDPVEQVKTWPRD